MDVAIKPERSFRKWINEAVRADINLCYACASCVSECPVNRAAGQLRPRQLVWMANLGLLNELIRLPDIWYCIQCNRCSNVCPMTVKPSALISFLRWEAVRQGVVNRELVGQHLRMQGNFHKSRWQASSKLMNGGQESGSGGAPPEPSIPTEMRLANVPTGRALAPGANSKALTRSTLAYLGYPTNITSCFACEECANACPVCFDREIFSPLQFIRMANYGFEEVLRAPGIWLCVQCQSCTEACSQKVRGHLVLQRLQQLAVDRGFVPRDFKSNWQEQQRFLFSRQLKAIDELLSG